MSKPQVNLNVDGIMLVGLLVGVPLLGFIGWKLWGARDAIASAVDKVNPASDKNFVYQGVNSVGSAVTGDENFTLGGWAFDVTHNADGTVNTGSIWDALKFTPLGDVQSINPANPENVINGGFNRVTQWLTGDEDFSLGGWVYDVTHDDPVTGAKAPINVVNPASDQNIIYKGVNGVGSYITGDKDFSLGGWLYGVFNE
jgi:hypothetical protein